MVAASADSMDFVGSTSCRAGGGSNKGICREWSFSATVPVTPSLSISKNTRVKVARSVDILCSVVRGLVQPGQLIVLNW